MLKNEIRGLLERKAWGAMSWGWSQNSIRYTVPFIKIYHQKQSCPMEFYSIKQMLKELQKQTQVDFTH